MGCPQPLLGFLNMAGYPHIPRTQLVSDEVILLRRRSEVDRQATDQWPRVHIKVRVFQEAAKSPGAGGDKKIIDGNAPLFTYGFDFGQGKVL